MSTSYQTSARPRGRRDTENSDRQSRSRAPTETTHVPSKKMSRLDDDLSARGSRPASPALFLQRNRTLDSKSIISDPLSPKSSSASIKAERPGGDGSDTPMVIPSSKSIPRSTPSVQGSFPLPEPRLSRAPTQSNAGSRPPTPMNKTSDTSLRSKAASVAQAASMQDSSATPPSPSISVSAKSLAAMQPSVEEALDGTSVSAPVPDQKQITSVSSVASTAPPPPPKPSVPEADLPTPRAIEEPEPPFQFQPPQPATPLVSPPQSPRLMHHGGYPGHSQMPYYYPHMMPGGPQMYNGSYYNAPFSPPSEHSMMSIERQSSGSMVQEENNHLLEKISGVLPDIHRLLDQYRETHGQLSAKDLLVKQSETVHADQLNRLKVELDANRTEYEKVIRDIVAENSRMKRAAEEFRTTISSLEQSLKEHTKLKPSLETLQSSHREISNNLGAEKSSKDQVLADKTAQDKQIEALQAQIAEHNKILADKDDERVRTIEEKELAHASVLEEKEKEHGKLMGEHKIILSKVQLELANLITKHSNQKKDLETARSSEAEHRSNLAIKTKELEDITVHHGEELETLRASNEEERQGMVNESEERIAKLIEDHSSKEKEWVQSVDAIRAEMQAQQDNFAKEREAHQAFQKSHDEMTTKHASLAAGIMSWKTKHSELQKENQNLDTLLQSLGHATETKTKGDDFFLAAFTQLSNLIAEVTRDYFQELPRTPPREIMLLIPTEIPEFMSNSESAYAIRCCFIQHKIYDVLQARIFQPFLFILDQQFAGVDKFLANLSHDIGRKSQRREAAWRQTTLRAAYKVPYAKESINLVATLIVNEIMAEIKHFTPRSRWSSLTTVVQRIVKAAAELWRNVRVEREMIVASFPDAVEMDDIDWQPTFQTLNQVEDHGLEEEPRIILRTVPHIVRQKVHPDLHDGDEIANLPCVYLQGQGLFSNSSVVRQRWREVEAEHGLRRGAPAQTPDSEAVQRALEESGVGNDGPPEPLSPLSVQSWESVGVR